MAIAAPGSRRSPTCAPSGRSRRRRSGGRRCGGRSRGPSRRRSRASSRGRGSATATSCPTTGAYLLTPNHMSNIDPVVVGEAVWRLGRAPRFLAKASLFAVPVVGAAAARARADPGRARRRLPRRDPALGGEAADRGGPGRHRLPGGVAHPRPRPVADARQDRRRAARAAARAAGDPGRALGRAGADAGEHDEAPPPAACPRRADLRRPGRPVRPRPRRGQGGARDRDRSHHGGDHRPARGAARRDRAGRALGSDRSTASPRSAPSDAATTGVRSVP